EQTRGPVVVVTDVFKLGAVSDFAVGPLEAVDVLVTDGDLPEPERTALDAARVQVVVPPVRVDR
ncbi:MAG TPA: hypothetical protein VFR44_12780, partial [Actinomycetota bacterium]|nr:hypothetical protein [Actinomycetota bacterium]